jgi:caffeoyl-CoA O-methyltransferase
MSDITIDLTPSVYQYLLNHSLREHEVLQALRHETHKLSAARMQISPEQGQFMALLIEMLDAKKTLDIGTFTGYSALVVALAMPEGGRVVACDLDTRATDIAEKYWDLAGVRQKIDLRIGKALETLDALMVNGEAGTFDFAFIDADKNNYLAYYEKSLGLLRKGGLIAVDNVLWSGAVADASNQDKDTNSIRKLNDFILNDDRVSISMLPIGDGLTLARKR